MFEKEAEEYADRCACLMEDIPIIERAYRSGAEFGYNKANEWHYVKNGDLPKEGEDVLLYFTLPDKSRNDIVIGNLNNGDFWNVDLEDVIAWKEIELPKELENV